jgi:hypothetical protein
MMHWKTAKDLVPGHREEVLIRYGGKANLAVFDESLRCFITRNGKKIDHRSTEVLWVRLMPPGVQ